MGSITDDLESCQNDVLALTTRVNGCDFELGQGDDWHLPVAHANRHLDTPFTFFVHTKILQL